MQGCITGRDVLRHSLAICRIFGPACYLRCLRAVVTRRRCTFLAVVAGQGPCRESARPLRRGGRASSSDASDVEGHGEPVVSGALTARR